MSKINKIGFFNKESGESLNYDIITSIQKEEVRNNVRRIFYNLQNKNIDDLSLEDLEVVMKLHKRNSENILIDLSANNEKYFIIKDNFKMCRKLDKNTKSMLYEISQLITYDNTIVTKNNIPLSNFRELCEYIEMPYSVWRNTVSKYNKEFNIIKKEKINNKFYLVLNPLFAIKSDFKLSKEVYDLFALDILKNESLFYSIPDKSTWDYIKKDVKNKIIYQDLDLKFNSDKHYFIVEYPINRNGIYVLFKNKEIIYIGKSLNMKNRISQHKKSKRFDSVKCIIFKESGMINLYEPYLIQKYKPRLNKELLENTNFELPEITLKELY